MAHALARRSHKSHKRSRAYRVGALAVRKGKRAAGKVAFDRSGALVGLGACAALGYAQKQGKLVAIGGYDASLVLGLLGAFAVPMVLKGKAGAMAAEAGAALAGVGVYKLAMGQSVKVSGDDESGYADMVGDDVEGDDD